MKFLKSGFMPFIIGIIIIVVCFFLSNFFAGRNILSTVMVNSVLNILFSFLFFISCCIVAFFYGKAKNKNGFRGLICIYALSLIVFILSMFIFETVVPFYITLPPPIFLIFVFILFVFGAIFSPIVSIFTDITEFAYTSLIIPMLIINIIIIIFIILSWFTGKYIYKNKHIIEHE